MIKLFFLIGVLLGCAPAQADTLELNTKRTIELRGVVTGYIITKADHLLLLAKPNVDNPQPIDVIINSPGGYVAPGMQFVAAMRIAKTRGYTIRCVVPTLAASMAFIIFNECDERYVLPTSYLLWHSVRVSLRGTFTPKDLKAMYLSMKRTAASVDNHLMTTMKLEPNVFWYHYHHESLLSGEFLNKITRGDYVTVVDDVTGYRGNLFSLGGLRGSLRDIIEQTKEIGPLQ